ncbi:MAG: hypothetical protein U5K37_06275 [Natrialbaceae archaeon]|nr:hypothetical protein [Natrialbaceae archaeon]
MAAGLAPQARDRRPVRVGLWNLEALRPSGTARSTRHRTRANTSTARRRGPSRSDWESDPVASHLALVTGSYDVASILESTGIPDPQTYRRAPLLEGERLGGMAVAPGYVLAGDDTALVPGLSGRRGRCRLRDSCLPPSPGIGRLERAADGVHHTITSHGDPTRRPARWR